MSAEELAAVERVALPPVLLRRREVDRPKAKPPTSPAPKSRELTDADYARLLG